MVSLDVQEGTRRLQGSFVSDQGGADVTGLRLSDVRPEVRGGAKETHDQNGRRPYRDRRVEVLLPEMSAVFFPLKLMC